MFFSEKVLLYSKLSEPGLYFLGAFLLLIFQGVYHFFSDSHPDSIFVGQFFPLGAPTMTMVHLSFWTTFFGVKNGTRTSK